MAIKKNVAISENGFIFDTGSGNSFTTNPIGLEIVEMLKHETPFDEIKTKIVERYEIDEVTVEKDLVDFVGMLNHLKLVDKQ